MEESHCYCRKLDPANVTGTFQCSLCKKRFHSECLKNPVQSVLKDDTFYVFKCCDCNEDKEEEYDRAKISWLDILTLTLYNLQLCGGGKYGYFRWKDHICAFIDKHWATLFGPTKKKTVTWHGTVAGTLSSGCPHVFKSGTAELGGTGWWKLVEMKPPVYYVDPQKPVKRGRLPNAGEVIGDKSYEENILDYGRSRRSKPFSLTAAAELKAKRASFSDAGRRKRKMKFFGEDDKESESALQEGDCKEDMQTDDGLPPAKVQLLIKNETDGEENFVPISSQDTDLSLSSMHTSSDLSGDMSSSLSQSETGGLFYSFHQPSHGFILEDVTQGPSAAWSEITMKQEKEDSEPDEASQLIDNADSDDSFEIDPETFSPTALNPVLDIRRSPGMDELMKNITATSQFAGKTVQNDADGESDVGLDSDYCPSEGEEEAEGAEESDEEKGTKTGEGEEEGEEGLKAEGADVAAGQRHRPRERRKREKEVPANEEEIPSNLHFMTLYEENLLLKKLNSIQSTEPISSDGNPLKPWEVEQLCQQRNRLRRKLIVRKLKRENGLPVFDLEATVMRLTQKYWGMQFQGLVSEEMDSPMNRRQQGLARTLDRYLMPHRDARATIQHSSFRTRLVGHDEDQLQPVTSPYTMRMLKPFIRRDTETHPLKLQLLQEIIAYPHRSDPTWKAPILAPLDYCYVRPQHISSVNSLCRTFFWPGIDLSECLQYPDFSCVVLYKKVVIAFAFMVPDVKHSEAYISFIFTHPEWRGHGIASFMIYHLIQTCMGKDVTLHVSVTNPALQLYQKFGFKAEELCLDFYDKYFPVDSRQCKHAFFMRLRR